jgi:putative transposase
MFFVTFRLAGSIPKNKINDLKNEYSLRIEECKKIKSDHKKNLEIFNLRKNYLVALDYLLHKIEIGPHYIKQPKIIKIVETELKRFDNEYYDLICYAIMSNHVHILIDTQQQLNDQYSEDQLDINYVPLETIMKRIKGPTAVYANRELERSGQFWE